MDALTAKLQRVARLRQQAADCAAVIQGRKDEIAKLPQGMALAHDEEVLRLIKEELAQAESLARTDTIYLYESTGAKDFDGAAVKLFTVVQYEEPLARAWCQVNAPNLLVLDKKRFEKGVADGILSPNIAKVVKEARAQLSGDLSKYLEDSHE